MELILKNVQKKHLTLITELAKTLKIEVADTIEDDNWYLAAMEKGSKTALLNADEKAKFIESLKG